MSDYVHDGSGKALTEDPARTFQYPWAGAPDIIRSSQKDSYFQNVLLTQLQSVIRSLYGTRSEHKWANEASVFTELLYLALTTFLGNRTLGEEYTDIVQVEDDTHRLPSVLKRTGYILSSVLLPYLLNRFLPAFRRRLRSKLEMNLRKAHHRRMSSPSRAKHPPTKISQFQEYILRHLDSITSPAPVYAVSLAVFYFTGAYYQLSKRIFGLRYIFTRKLEESDQRAGYEVLGVLLVVQMVVQAYLHMQTTYKSVQEQNVQLAPGPTTTNALDGGSAVIDNGVELGAENHFNTPLLFEANPRGNDPEVIKRRVAQVTHTPLASGHRYDLKDAEVMQWIESKQQRKCTLCLEQLKDPAATTCSHVFCWTCITDWLREQPLCPLCRQSTLVQHVLPLRG